MSGKKKEKPPKKETAASFLNYNYQNQKQEQRWDKSGGKRWLRILGRCSSFAAVSFGRGISINHLEGDPYLGDPTPAIRYNFNFADLDVTR